MKKIISLYQRNYDGDRLVRDELVPGAEWVPAGEGIATRKFDGTCCMVRAGQLFKRYDAKAGKTPPAGFEAAQEPDAVTGHHPGWLPVGEGPDDRWHREAMKRVGSGSMVRRFGTVVRELRNARGLSGPGLAALAGISKGNLSKMENHGVNVSLETIEKLAAALQVTPAILMTKCAAPNVEMKHDRR